MANDYAYINGRVRVMRTELITERSFDELLSSSSYAEFLRLLSEGSLAEDLRDTTSQNSGLGELDAALSRNFHRIAQKVHSFGKGESARELGVVVAKWDLINLKTLARGIMKGRSSEAITEALIPGGTFPLEVLKAASSSSDLLAAATTLSAAGVPLARIFRDAAQAFAASNDAMDFEVSLDKGFYAWARSSAKSNSLKRLLGREIDLRNAFSARQIKGQANPGRFFVEGGNLTESEFVRLAGGDVTAATALLAPVFEALTLEEADLISRKLMDEAASNAALSDTLGPGVAAEFLRRKEIEIAKLRLIGRGKFYGVPVESLRKELGNA